MHRSTKMFRAAPLLQLLRVTRQTGVARKTMQIEELDNGLESAVFGLAFITSPSIIPLLSQLLTKSLTFLFSVLLPGFRYSTDSSAVRTGLRRHAGNPPRIVSVSTSCDASAASPISGSSSSFLFMARFCSACQTRYSAKRPNPTRNTLGQVNVVSD